jgi:hypothetical protein
MTRDTAIGALVVLAVGGQAGADLYLVAFEAEHPANYYRLSTLDASVELVATYPKSKNMFELDLGVDGHYYGLGSDWYGIYRVDPQSGDYEELFSIYAQQFPSGALTVSTDGELWVTSFGFETKLWQWDIEHDYLLDITHIPADIVPVAMAQRQDGVLVMTHAYDGTVHAVDPVTGESQLLGTIAGAEGAVLSFALEKSSGKTFMLARDADEVVALYEVDLFSLEATWVGDLPRDAEYYGIAWLPCAADFNLDGQLNVLDFVALQLAWQAGDDAADVNADGVLDVLDFVSFQGLFQEGCA